MADTRRCAKCGATYDAQYDGCPTCTQKRTLAQNRTKAVATLLWMPFALLLAYELLTRMAGAGQWIAWPLAIIFWVTVAANLITLFARPATTPKKRAASVAEWGPFAEE